jgi:hypothetical protein
MARMPLTRRFTRCARERSCSPDSAWRRSRDCTSVNWTRRNTSSIGQQRRMESHTQYLFIRWRLSASRASNRMNTAGFPFRDGPNKTCECRHTLLIHVVAAGTRGNPYRHEPRLAAHMEDARRQGWRIKGNPRSHPEPCAAGRQLNEL